MFECLLIFAWRWCLAFVYVKRVWLSFCLNVRVKRTTRLWRDFVTRGSGLFLNVSVSASFMFLKSDSFLSSPLVLFQPLEGPGGSPIGWTSVADQQKSSCDSASQLKNLPEAHGQV